MSDHTCSRRHLLRRGALLALGLGGMAACTRGKEVGPASCTDPLALAPDDALARQTLGYVEPAANKGRACVSCQQFIPAASPGSCGACKVMKGPIHPEATCKVFSPRSV